MILIPITSALFLHIDDSHIYITRQYVLSILQTIYPTVYWTFPAGRSMNPQRQPIQNRVDRLFPKAGTPSGFLTMITGASAHPIKPSTSEPPMTPSVSAHDHVCIFLSSKHLLSLQLSSHCTASAIVRTELSTRPPAWGTTWQLCSLYTVQNHLADGQSEGRHLIHPQPSSLVRGLRAVSLQRISFL